MMHSEIMAIGLLTSSERRDHVVEVNELKKDVKFVCCRSV